MKKIALALSFTAAFAFTQAQDGNNICTWNAMNTYNTGGGAEDLERGIKCTDEAAVNPSTADRKSVV